MNESPLTLIESLIAGVPALVWFFLASRFSWRENTVGAVALLAWVLSIRKVGANKVEYLVALPERFVAFLLLVGWLAAFYFYGTGYWAASVPTGIVLLAFIVRPFIDSWRKWLITAWRTWMRQRRDEPSKAPDKRWRYVALGLLIAVIASVAAIFIQQQSMVPRSVLQEEQRQLQENNKLLHEIQQSLEECLKLNHNAQGTGGVLTAKLDPEIQSALLLLVKKLPPCDGWPAWAKFWIVIVALIAACIIFWKHSESVPIAGAVALSTWVIKHADHFPKMKLPPFWWVLILFVTLAIASSSPFVSAAWTWSKGKKLESEEKTTKTILSINFSLATLAWSIVVAVLMAYCSDCTAITKIPQSPPPAQNPQPASTELQYHRLQPETLSMKGSAGYSEQDRADRVLKAAIDQGVKDGDVLLLLGSADCLRFHPGSQSGSQSGSRSNDVLARDRARELKDYLDTRFAARKIKVQIEFDALPQHIECREKPDLRAVYPFLIQKVSGP